MTRLGHALLSMLAVIVMLGSNALADVDPQLRAYYVTYYSNANTTGAPDGTLRLVNDGDASRTQVEGVPDGNLYADIYVFDDSQELQECCSCFVSADGLLSESVNKNLTANELTGRAETSRGVIKVISSPINDPTNPQPRQGLRGWMTHIQDMSTNLTTLKATAPFYVTEDPLADSNLSKAESDALSELCSLAITLGSGYGICSCTPEDHDF